MSDEKTRAQQQFELEFEEFLRDDEARLAALYRKLPLAAPDAELDARVHALAQRELALSDEDDTNDAKADAEDANLTPTRMFLRHPRWLPALGAAAMLVLAAGIAWRMAPPGGTSRERGASAPAPAAPAATTARAEQKAKLDSIADADHAANALRESAAAKPSAATAPPAVATQSQPSALAKVQPPAAEPVRAKAPGDVPTARPKPESQAFPALSAPPEAERRQPEKVENAASAATYATPAPPPPAAPPPAAEAVPSVAQSARADEVNAKQALPPRASAPAGAALHDASRAKSVAAPAPASAVGSVQSSMAACPASQADNNWRGRYPPEIPPTPLLRRQVVKNLIGQAHREEARRAYADLHARCPDDSWPPDILNQLHAQ